MAKASLEDLREFVKEYSKRGKLGELSHLVGVSKSYLSMFSSKSANWDSSALVKKLQRLYDRKRLTVRDERRLMNILEILDECNDRDAVIRQFTDESL